MKYGFSVTVIAPCSETRPLVLLSVHTYVPMSLNSTWGKQGRVRLNRVEVKKETCESLKSFQMTKMNKQSKSISHCLKGRQY